MFCIAEQHGNQETKYRAIDNSTVGASDTYFLLALDTFIVLARLQRKYGATKLRMWPLGCFNAYKTIGPNEASKDVSRICIFNPNGKRMYKAPAIVLLFGSREALPVGVC